MSLPTRKRRTEAPPERPRPARLSGVTPGRLGCAPGTSRSVIDTLMADEPSPAEQVRALKDAAERKIWAILHMGPLNTDWSARIVADWKDVSAQFKKLNLRIVAEQIGVERSYAVAVCMLTAPFIAECEALQTELAPFAAKAEVA